VPSVGVGPASISVPSSVVVLVSIVLLSVVLRVVLVSAPGRTRVSG
jgi:hypothetical protein